MRYLTALVVLVGLFLSDAALGSVQPQTSAQEKAASLRAQLNDIETKQAELQTRLQSLDAQLQPENIEKYLAGVGSTHPEDLREQRRRQLEIERNGVQKQLDLLNTSHTRLETALAQADAEAYRQSAAPSPAPTVTSSGPSTNSQVSESTVETNLPTHPRRTKKKKAKRHKIQNRER